MSVHMTPPSAPLLSPSTLMLPRETQIHTYHHLSAPIPLGSSAAKGRGAELVGILLIIRGGGLVPLPCREQRKRNRRRRSRASSPPTRVKGGWGGWERKVEGETSGARCTVGRRRVRLDSRRSMVSVGDVMSVHMTPPSAPLLSPSTLMLPRETQIHTYHHLSAPIPLGSSAAKGRGAELVGILLIIRGGGLVPLPCREQRKRNRRRRSRASSPPCGDTTEVALNSPLCSRRYAV